MTHRELEDLLTVEGREVLRQLYQDHLTLRGPGRAAEPVVDRDGVAHPHAREQGRDLETVFGTVRVERVGYGGRGLDSLPPLDAELNLPAERHSHGVRRRVAEEAPRGSFSELRGDGAPVARPRPENKRVWARVDKPADEVIGDLFAEALCQDPEHKKRWVSVVDRNLSQLDSLLDHAQRYRVELTVIVDFGHVLEYVWKAALAFHAEGTPQAEHWVDQRFLEILRGHASRVAAGMRRSATLLGLTGAKRAAVDKCANYLLGYSQYLRYDQYLAAGLPIASGVIEGACRHLVADRMDLTGARWSVPGAEAVLRLRALRISGDLDEYWRFHEAQEHLLNYEMAYAEAVPTVLHPKRLGAAESTARSSKKPHPNHLTLVP